MIVVKGLDADRARIRVESVVGPGRTGGVVYRAKDGAGTPIRVHELDPAGATPESIATFLEEAKLLARVSEATFDVERLVAYGVAEDRLAFTAFEWVEGRSLAEEIAERKGSPRSLDEAIAILEPAARGLAAAHALGAFHGDVRPENLWLCDQGGRTQIKLTQFPLASRLGPREVTYAPGYGAPEHFNKSYGAIGPATDVYGLALCLVELVTGRRALEGADDAELYLATSDLQKRPTARARGASLAPAAEAVLARSLAVDPKRRYDNTRAMWDALVAALAERAPESAAQPAVKAGPRTSRRRGISVWVGIVAVAAFLLVVVASQIPKASPPPPPPAIGLVAPPPPPASSPAPEPLPRHDAVVVAPFLTDMVRIPAGEFTMGVDREGKGDGPSHQVTITKAFYIDRTEVTTEAYATCLEERACTKPRVHVGDVDETTWGCNAAKDKPKHPQNCIDRHQAEKYCVYAGKRLPTEAEWEYAARGADRRAYPWGTTAPASCLFAIVSSIPGECSERKGTFEVGYAREGKSASGALDMSGNVWEWVADGYEPYSERDATDPTVPLTPIRRGIMRGGSWDYSALAAKTSYRMPFMSTAGGHSTGVRCARDAD